MDYDAYARYRGMTESGKAFDQNIRSGGLRPDDPGWKSIPLLSPRPSRLHKPPKPAAKPSPSPTQAAMKPVPSPTLPPATLNVKVGDKITLQPLGGVKVIAYVNGRKLAGSETDSNGCCTMNIPGGPEATVQLQLAGYKPMKVTKPIVNGTVSFSGTLQPLKVTVVTITISAVELADDKIPISNYKVVASAHNKRHEKQITGHKETFNFPFIPDGESIRIDVAKDGYVPLSGELKVVKGDASATVKLAKSITAKISGPATVKMTDKTEHKVQYSGGAPDHTFQWFFDGVKADVSKNSISIIVAWENFKPGQHTIDVIVTDSAGNSAKDRQVVLLEGENLTLSARGPRAATARGGVPPYSYAWVVNGVRQSAASPTITVSWPQPGKFVLEIQVSDGAGASRALRDTIIVKSRQGSVAKPQENPYVKGFEGTWDTNWGRMVLSASGSSVTGNYTHDSGFLHSVSRRQQHERFMVLRGEWRRRGLDRDEGEIEWRLLFSASAGCLQKNRDPGIYPGCKMFR